MGDKQCQTTRSQSYRGGWISLRPSPRSRFTYRLGRIANDDSLIWPSAEVRGTLVAGTLRVPSAKTLPHNKPR